MSLDLDIHVRREHFSLEVQVTAPAGVTVIFGPSGCGKTTLLRVVAGLEPVDHGKIVIDGSDMTEQPAHRRAVGYLFQEPRLLPHLNVLGNLKFAQRMGRQVRGQSFDEVIALLELDPLLGRAPFALSGGEAQRVKLSRELSKRDTGKTLYILDEPTTGLHFHDIKQLLAVLHHLRDQGNTIVVIEHNLDVIKTADWVVDLGPEGGSGGGMIIAEGTPEQIAKNKKSHTGVYIKQHLAAGA